MVSYKEILASNALINDATAPRIAVFVGGTSGIGKLTIRALVGTGTSLRIYLIGRKSSQERTHTSIQELHAINPKAEIIWTEGDISLLAETKRICEIIKSKESRIDLLFLTAGYAPFGAREETSEGLEITQSLEYYSRILFILHLLPLLNASENPRVVSVLAGGLEQSTIDLSDLSLKKPGNFARVAKAQVHYATMNTTTMEKLASENSHITFIHSWPGWVNTGNVRRSFDPNSWLGWFICLVLEPIIGFLAFSDEEAGQRYLFLCSSAAFGGRGVPWFGKMGANSLGKESAGLFLVDYKCDCRMNGEVMAILREKAMGKIWEHTMDVLGSYL